MRTDLQQLKRDLESGSDLAAAIGVGTPPESQPPTATVDPTAVAVGPVSPTIADAPAAAAQGKGPARRWVVPAVLLLALGVTSGGFLWRAHERRLALGASPNSIAVLPFADLSPGRDQQYFSDGLADQLISDLTKIPGLKVAARSSAFQFQAGNQDPRRVGDTLGVATVLEGSVQREGDRVRITAELIKTSDGFQLWSETYDRRITDILAVQDEIARAVAGALKVKLLGANGATAATASASNPDAYQAYLKASFFHGRGQNREDLGKALAYADQAIKLDAKSAPAWALRAAVLDTMAAVALMDNADGFRQAREAAEQAIALDPNLASGYLALALVQMYYDWNWDAAQASLKRAAELEPGSVEGLRDRSQLSRFLGRLDEAIALYRRAIALDPLQSNSYLVLGNLLYSAGQYDEAQAALQKALELNPRAAYVHFIQGKILLAKGRPQEALAEVEQEPSDWAKMTGEALVYQALGRHQDADAALAGLIATHANDSAFQIAEVYAYRGEPDKAFEWLDTAYQQRDPGMPEIKTDTLLKNLRHDPRFTQLLRKMRLPV